MSASRTIRASMLPGYADCARRAASKQFRALVEDRGFTLRPMLPSVGAAVGTAVHHAVAHVLRARMCGAPVTPALVGEGVAESEPAFLEEISPGAEWDATTGNTQVAQFQIARMTEVAVAALATRAEPVLVEADLRATVAPGWELSGHLDLFDAAAHLDDLKTGALLRPYQAQLGAYSLLLRANGYAPASAGITFVPRSKKSKPQAPAQVYRYDLADSERAAYGTAQAIIRDVAAFEKTGDPFAFPANPMSMMCTRRYCGAWGTKFCTMHLPKEDDHDGID